MPYPVTKDDAIKRGCLDIVRIHKKIEYDEGTFVHFERLKSSGERAIVHGVSEKHIGLEVLVRVPFEQENLEEEIVYFISSEISDDFKGLGKDEYILLAQWDKTIDKRMKPNPKLEDIKGFYDPGDLQRVAYFGTCGSLGEYRIIQITPSVSRDMKDGIKAAIHQLSPSTLYSLHTSRLILFEKELQLKSLVRVIEEMGMEPVLMGPFKE